MSYKRKGALSRNSSLDVKHSHKGGRSGGEKGRNEEGGVLLVNEMQSSAGRKTRCRYGERAPGGGEVHT
ncbi:hypothetical protein QVD17_31450 [Tagetes erecta]|uniref:Uncharacterized protein n=1 Tax=Tagetes erecta TaxID=13708 RepID=A0AAD8NH21_TARER|nr:hypothetical protein QVD17_31450 [Tagetes erecta]